MPSTGQLLGQPRSTLQKQMWSWLEGTTWVYTWESLLPVPTLDGHKAESDSMVLKDVSDFLTLGMSQCYHLI